MSLVCTYCGAVGNQRDQQNGRCGSCSSFYTGNEVSADSQIEESSQPIDEGSVTTGEKSQLEMPPGAATPDPSSPVGSNKSNPSTTEPNDPESFSSDSEALVRPRKLSPHFKRRVERTWGTSLGEPGMTSMCTFSSTPDYDSASGGGEGLKCTSTFNVSGSSQDTKSAHSTLSIATRRILPVTQKGKGDYELNEVIGEGSMGKVWSARQTSLDRNVAVKVPRPELADSGSIGEGQFISEVVVTGKLEHPNIVPIYELGRDTDGVPFYSMKHVQGKAWNESIEEKSLQENLEILMKVCDAVAFAHDRHFLHRDIKPHNVMVGEFGEVSVMDWGIAISISKDPDQPWAAVASGPAGTPAYMAPEMATHNSSELGVVSDVYLLGATLYEMVTGTPPHPRTGDPHEALLAAAANEINPTDKSGELIDIARRAMATNVLDRYQSVTELQDAIRQYQSHRESISLSDSANDHLAKAKKDNNSDEFARARFGFEESLKLWPENSSAAAGLQIATLEYAKNALAQENYELGISILDSNNPSHRDLLGKLETKRSASRRLALFSKVAAGTALAAVLAVVVVTISKNRELDQEREEAVAARNDAIEAQKEAVAAQNSAISEAKRAREAEQQARSARDAAVMAKIEARDAEGTAREEKRNAEIASYASDIGLAAESIRRNAFNKATSILSGLKPDPSKETVSIRSRLRHIEWGLLQDASTPGPIVNLLDGQRIESVASSLDGNVLAVGTENGNVYLWRDRNNAGHHAPPIAIAFGKQVSTVAVSRDGRYLAAAGIAQLPSTKNQTSQPNSENRYSIAIWDTSAQDFGNATSRLIGHSGQVFSVVFSADATQVLSSAADRRAILWDRSNAKMIATAKDHLDRNVWSARFSPSEQQIATACDDGRVRIWKLDEQNGVFRKQYDLRGHEGPVYAVEFASDGQSVISGGYDRRLLRWPLENMKRNSHEDLQAIFESDQANASSGSLPYQLVGSNSEQHEASIHSISLGSVDEREYVLTGGNDNTIRVWSVSGNGERLEKVLRGHGRWVRGCVFSQSGQTVLSGAHDGAKIWRWREYSMPRELFPIAERRFGKEPSELGISATNQSIYSPDGRWVATAYQNGTVAAWDVESTDRTASQLLVDGHSLLTATGVFYQSGSKLLTSAGDNTTRLWDVQRGTQTLKLEGTGWRGAADVIQSDDLESTWVLSGSDDPLNPAALWKIQNDRVAARLPLLSEFARQFLPNGDEVLSYTDRISEQWRKEIPDVTIARLSPNGDRFLLGNAVGQVFLYQFDEGTGIHQKIRTIAAHGAEVRAAVFHPSGDSLLTASADGQVKHWSALDGSLIETLPWAGPVTSLAISENGNRLLIGHSPLKEKPLPAARLFDLTGNSATLVTVMQGWSNTRPWENNRPSIQSVQFVPHSDRALVSLYFPAAQAGSKASNRDKTDLQGYRIGYWDLKDSDGGFALIETHETGEVSSAVIRPGASGEQILMVGGKGARLWKSNEADPFRLDQLSASFRPSNSITTIDFSIDPANQITQRLVAGDRDGNLRVWELNGNQWSERLGAAAQISGHHDGPLVATLFDPLSPNHMVSVDRNGNWNHWEFRDTWCLLQSGSCSSEMIQCAALSPDGRTFFMGGQKHSYVQRKNLKDRFESGDTSWKTGPVANAAFTLDGVWLVTTDSDKSVRIWDTSGDVIATMPTEDAKGVATLALTSDRRRLITGHHDKRIVIWDTSSLVDGVSAENASGDSMIKELLTLEEHRRGVTSLAISPDGQHVLTAGEEGRTIIWSGQAIAPVSLSPSRTQVAYQPNSGYVRLDRSITLMDPSRLADFTNAEIHVAVDGASNNAENLTILQDHSGTGERIEIHTDSEGQKCVQFFASPASGPVTVGRLMHNAGPTADLKIKLNHSANPFAVQTILRCLAYQAERTASRSKDGSGLNVTQASEKGQNSQSEMDGTRMVSVTINGMGLKHSDENDTDDSSSEEIHGRLQTTLSIETDNAQQAPAADETTSMENAV